MAISVSIIIPFHNNKRFLDYCLSSLSKDIPPYGEIIVVMNNNDQLAINWELQNYHPNLKVIRVYESLGYSKAINLGVTHAKGDVLFFCDTDTFYPSAWFKPMLDLLNSNTQIAMVSAKLVNPDSGRLIDFGMGLTKYNNAHPYLDRPLSFDLVQKNRHVQMACSACMAIKKEAFLSVGAMDEELVNFYQDTDLCLRLNEAGYEIWVCADAVVYHRGDSDHSNRAPYKADVKGWYVAKNASRMKIDMDGYFKESYQHLKKNTSPNTAYTLLDLSSVADRQWHQELIMSLFHITTTHCFPARERDQSRIELISILDADFLGNKQPSIFFVDRHISLSGNDFWKAMRGDCGDLVIDRHANMLPLSNLA